MQDRSACIPVRGIGSVNLGALLRDRSKAAADDWIARDRTRRTALIGRTNRHWMVAAPPGDPPRRRLARKSPVYAGRPGCLGLFLPFSIFFLSPPARCVPACINVSDSRGPCCGRRVSMVVSYNHSLYPWEHHGRAVRPFAAVVLSGANQEYEIVGWVPPAQHRHQTGPGRSGTLAPSSSIASARCRCGSPLRDMVRLELAERRAHQQRHTTSLLCTSPAAMRPCAPIMSRDRR